MSLAEPQRPQRKGPQTHKDELGRQRCFRPQFSAPRPFFPVRGLLILMDKQRLKQIKPKIVSLCENENAVIAAFLFGSHAIGKAKETSDLDVALLVDETEHFSLLDFISSLERNVGCRTDVVVLNKAAELLKYEVRRDGILLFERSSRKRTQFDIKSRKHFEDFLYLHNRYTKEVLYGNVVDHGN